MAAQCTDLSPNAYDSLRAAATRPYRGDQWGLMGSGIVLARFALLGFLLDFLERAIVEFSFGLVVRTDGLIRGLRRCAAARDDAL